jgi:hypothetical protein
MPTDSEAHHRIDKLEELLLRLVEANNVNATSITTLSSNVQIVADSVKQLSDKIDPFVEALLRNTGNGCSRPTAA